MDTSLSDSQKSSVQFFTEERLARLYEKEYDEQYLSGIFGPFLPTEKGQWTQQMLSAQQTVQTRIGMVGGDTHEAAARLMFGIIKGHKLADGNKRSSILCMVGFYFINGYTTTFNPDDLYHKAKRSRRPGLSNHRRRTRNQKPHNIPPSKHRAVGINYSSSDSHLSATPIQATTFALKLLNSW